MKIGSLFDGSGGFPLAASLCGISPVWASEIEPYPIAVTRSRFPAMKHLGDISKINGAEIEPVDIITFGSPCQDLSVAGKRAGLKHTENGDDETTRSGLFMEAVRIIKEMREATNGNYPRFALWENVPGAFSSNKGEDFRVVLEELIKIVEPAAVVPPVPKNGWAYADYFRGDGWSLAWRVLDSQYIRTAQRRRRIYLVLDFRTQCAREILFERESLRGYTPPCEPPREETARYVGSSAETADRKGVCFGISSYDSNAMKSSNPHSGFYEAETSRTLDMNGGNPACNQGGIAVVEPIPYTLKIRSGVEVDSAGKAAGKGALIQENLSATLGASQDQYLFQPVAVGFDCYNQSATGDKAKALSSAATDSDHVPVVFCKEHRAASADDATTWKEAVVTNTLNAFDVGEVRANELVVEQHLFENHSQDSRYRGPLEVCPMLPAQLGTGGNNQPFVVEETKVYESHPMDSRIKELDDVSPTVSVKWHKGTADTPIVCMATQQGGAEIRTDDKAPTITAAAGMSGNNQPVLCMATGQANAEIYQEKCPTLNCVAEQPILFAEADPIVLDRAFYNQGQNAQYEPQFYDDGTVPTLVAKGPSAVCVRYIVRRLTPTECARLQGFPDKWGHPDKKDDLTDEEYRFWLDVRNTHAAINGKAVKDYTPQQMLVWYNKLHTDSAEYKMWGNGVALPCVLFVMQGIQDAAEVTE